MPRKRNRRCVRSKRLYSKENYQEAATTIQRCFQRYLRSRYSGMCSNSEECILLEPVSHIPRELFVHHKNTGFDSRSLLRWLTNSNRNPLTREAFSPGVGKECVRKVIMFAKHEISRKCGKRGHYRRRKECTNLIQNALSYVTSQPRYSLSWL